jgi:hypothetical protein
MFAQHSEDAFLPPLRYKYHVIFAVPSRMAQALILFHCESPFSWQRSEIHADRRKGQTLVSPPAEPGAYLDESNTTGKAGGLILLAPQRRIQNREPPSRQNMRLN